MAGRGPAPKPKGSRARRNKDPQILRIITAQPVEQPSLPVIEQVVLDENGKPRKKRFTWPTVTRRWWKMWGESPLSAEYTETDWSFLLDTAYLHALYWKGDYRVAGELRLRVAKFGATPEDVPGSGFSSRWPITSKTTPTAPLMMWRLFLRGRAGGRRS